MDEVMVQGGGWANGEAAAALIGEHLARRPLMQVQDVYKLIYQGVMGAEHILGAQFEAHLRAEFTAVAANEDEPLFEAVEPGRRLYRVNLAPYKARNGAVDRLAAACLRAGRLAIGSMKELHQAWQIFEQLYAQGCWPNWPIERVTHFSAWLAEAGYPAVHHSEIYRGSYHPAYRLVGEGWKTLQV